MDDSTEKPGRAELVRLQLQRADVQSLVSSDSLLQAAPFFRAIGGAGLAELLGAAAPFRCPAGDALVREGEAGRSLFLVLGGEVRLRVGRGKELVEIGVARKGEFFGEGEVLRGGPRRMSAIAGPGLVVAELGHEQLAPHLARSVELRSLLEQALVTREQAKRELDDFLNRW